MESIVSGLNDHAEKYKHKKAFIFINEHGDEIDELSYAQLHDDAEKIASFLQSVCKPCDRVLLLFQPGLDYIRALFGCFIAGVIAVPLYPPRRNKKAERILRVAESCGYSLILCGEQDKAAIASNFDAGIDNITSTESIRLYTVETIKKNGKSTDSFPSVSSKDIAFLQYTSGSTGVPKGVIINHENALGNVNALTNRVQSRKHDIFVNWLPLFHDLGLITAVLWPVYLGATSILISPAHFVRNPILWLNAITKYRGTICGAPNFAYQLCCKKITDDLLPTLDLSSWRIAYNAAEPIQFNTIKDFKNKFSASQLMPSALLASYGMAEATAFISCSDVDREVSIYHVDAECFAKNEIVPRNKNTKKIQSLVGCGKTYLPHDIRVVNPATCQELPDDHIGEVWFSGPSVSKGYWELPKISKETFGQSLEGFSNEYMRTGDFGFMHEGEIFITGRMKDLIIIEGRNYYPQDIEWHAEQYNTEVAAGACAAFALSSDEGEKLVIVAEIARSAFRNNDLGQVVKNIRHKIVSEFFVYPELVVLVKPLSMPKTSSGKIQRKLTKELLQKDQLDILFHSDDLPAVEYTPPSNDCEKKLCVLISDILAKDDISVTSNFLELGGKSLTAMQCIGAIKEVFNGIEISFEQLFASPSIRELAVYIEKRNKLEALHRHVMQEHILKEEFEV